jgi:flagellar motor switch protein FliG
MSLAPMTTSEVTAVRVRNLSRPQKVAAVMLALGSEVSEVLLKRMTDYDIEQIAQEVVKLGSLDPDELIAVLEEFHAEAQAHRYIVTGGENYARELLRAWRGDDADAIMDRLVASVRETPFSWLNFFEPDAIARQLIDELPQTAAVVLGHLPTRFGAKVLAELPSELRPDVAMRVATMQPAPREIVERIEDSMRARLGDSSGSVGGPSKGSGLRELANMLNNSEEPTSRAILDAIEVTDAQLAKDIRAHMFVFADLVTLTPRDLQEVLRQIETTQLALAMKGLEGELYETIMGNLSERARQALNEERELLGPVKATEVEAARAEIAAHVRQLVEEGTVTVIRGDGSDLVA